MHWQSSKNKTTSLIEPPENGKFSIPSSCLNYSGFQLSVKFKLSSLTGK